MKYLLLVCWDTERMNGQTEPDRTSTADEDEEGFPWVDELRAKGVKIVREPGPMKHGSGANAIAFLEDPNGYKIELTTRAEK